MEDEKFLRLFRPIWDTVFRTSLWKIRTINKKSFNNVLKFDLWDEISKSRSEILKLDYYIRKLIRPNKLVYVEIVSKFCLKYNQTRQTNENVVNGDITTLPFKKNSFDLIIDFSTTDHMDDTNLNSVFKNVRNTLKKNGLYLIYHLNKDYFNIEDWNSSYQSKLFPSIARSTDEIKNLLIKNKLEVLDSGFFFPFFLDRNLFISQRIKNTNWLIEKQVTRKFLYNFLNSKKMNIFFYVIATKSE